MPTPAELQEAFPGSFETVPDAAIQRQIDAATRRTPESVFGDQTEDAILYLAAHLVMTTVANRARAQGATSYSAGPVSMSFGAGATGEQRTSFLDEYERIRRGLARGPVCP